MDDVPHLCVMLDMLRKETVWGNVPFTSDYNHAAKVLVQRLNNGWHKILVADTGRRLIGLCAGQVMTNDFIPTVPYLWEWAWWVHPNHRKEPIGKTLKETLAVWAKGRGAMGMAYGIPHMKRRDTTTELVVWTYWGPGCLNS